VLELAKTPQNWKALLDHSLSRYRVGQRSASTKWESTIRFILKVAIAWASVDISTKA
jgi:hypothetical protein